jgi:ectoine hydroxylase-related dioxygenase (phytanoyl-CoA dioxygenase family)
MKPDERKVREIRERGFAVVKDVVSPSEAAVMRNRLQECIDEDLERWKDDPTYPDRWMVMNLMVRGAPFARFLENDVIQAYFGELLGDTCIIYAYTSSSMPPGGTNYSHRIHVDCPRLIPGYVTNAGVLLALDDFTPENGATYLLPGSHTRGEKPSEEEFLAKAERVYPKAGDGVFLNARTWHMGAPNRTDKARHAISMNVCRAYMRQRFDYPRLVPQQVVDSLGEVGRRFLGFNVRMPTSLEEYYVPEERRLYKNNQG